VFMRLRGANLKLKPGQTVPTRITVSRTPDFRSRCADIVRWHRPTSVHEVRQFLGLCGYYHRYVRDYWKLVMSLHELTKRGEVFEWTTERNPSHRLRVKVILGSRTALLHNVQGVSPNDLRAETLQAVPARTTIHNTHRPRRPILPSHHEGPDRTTSTLGRPDEQIYLYHPGPCGHLTLQRRRRILPCEKGGNECTQCHKHIRKSFIAENDEREDEVICVRKRVLRLSQEEQMDTGLEPTMIPARPEAQPGRDESPAATKAAAFVLVDLQNVPRTPEKPETTRTLSPGCPEEFIVLDDSEDPSYIQCSQVFDEKISSNTDDTPPSIIIAHRPGTPQQQAEPSSPTFEDSHM